MKKKGFFVASLVFAIALPFVFPNVGIPSSKKILKLAINHPFEHPNGLQSKWIAEIVNKGTNGEIVIQVYPSSQLGGIEEQIYGVKTGTIEMCSQTFSAFSAFYDDLGVFNIPYLYRSMDHSLKVTSQSSPILQKMNNHLATEVGIRIIGNIYEGDRMLTCNSPVYKPEDLKGKKIRAIPQPSYIALVEGMGGIAVPVDFKELPSALASGIVQGQENPLTTIYASKLHEIQKYVMLTRHDRSFAALSINEKVWQGLTEDQRKIILKAAEEARNMMVERVPKLEGEMLAKLKGGGMTVIREEDGLDINAFRERVLNHCIKKFPKWANYIKDIQEIK